MNFFFIKGFLFFIFYTKQKRFKQIFQKYVSYLIENWLLLNNFYEIKNEKTKTDIAQQNEQNLQRYGIKI